MARTGDTGFTVARRADLAHRIAFAGGLLLCTALPFLMALANRSAPLLLALAAACALVATLLLRLHHAVLARASACLPLVAALCLVLCWMAASLVWGHDRSGALRQFLEMAVPLLAGIVACLCFPLLPRRSWAVLLAVGIVAFSLFAVFDLVSGHALRKPLGIRAIPQGYNRGLVLCLILSPALLACAQVERRWFAAAALLPLVAAISIGESQTAQLGLIVGAVVLAVAFMWPTFARHAGLALFVSVMALAPVSGTLAARLMGPGVDRVLEGGHAGDRIAIWQSFEAAAQARPLLGNGYGASLTLPQAPVVADVPPALRKMLGASHPHNIFLQIWVELGAVGAVLFTVLGGLMFRTIGRLAGWVQPYALTTFAMVCVIALVSHGAWQAWWIATLLVAITLFAAMPRREDAPRALGSDRLGSV